MPLAHLRGMRDCIPCGNPERHRGSGSAAGPVEWRLARKPTPEGDLAVTGKDARTLVWKAVRVPVRLVARVAGRLVARVAGRAGARVAGRAAGFVLLDALGGLALLGLLAVGALSLVQGGARVAREAAHVDRAVAVARSAVAHWEAASFRALPGQFGADPDDWEASVDTAGGGADGGAAGGAAGGADGGADGDVPDELRELVSVLPGGRLRAELAGLGPTGATARFSDCVAMRETVTVSWDAVGGFRRRVAVSVTR
jgi:hypothetical protein